MVLYSLALTAAALVLTPWWVVKVLRTPGHARWLGERLRGVPAAVRQHVRGKRVVWLHAVSVGETLAATRLRADLLAALNATGEAGWAVVVSCTTLTGYRLAQERFGADAVFLFPFDFATSVRRVLDALQPRALVLMESELWPRTLYECRRRAIPVAVANARMSDRSFARAGRVRPLWRHVLAMVTLFLAQSDADAERLRSLGAPRVAISGNLKYDVRAPRDSRLATLIREAAEGRPIIVAGSTTASTTPAVADEEVQVVIAWQQTAPLLDTILVLAPRHPQRFAAALEICSDAPHLRATDLLAGKVRTDATARSLPPGQTLDSFDILLLDTIGDLAAVYGIADVAYVGGSLVSRGGHNPLEPAQFGVPVVIGSSYENFRDIVETMRKADAIRVVADEGQLADTFDALLRDRSAARALGARGQAVFDSQQGATARTVASILKLVQP